jgi:hypothetical protein
MLCHCCAGLGTERPGVALRHGCNAELSLDHLLATAAHSASSHLLHSCHHDAWTLTERRSSAVVPANGGRKS